MITPRWDLPQGVRALITTCDGGISEAPYQFNNLALHVGDQRSAVLQNRAQLLRRQSGIRAIQWLNQTHSDRVVPAYSGSVVPDADGCFSSEPGLACAVLTADCLPVLIAAKDGSQVAAVHAGWRGLAAGIIAKAIRHFDSDVSVFLGPAIGPEHFEVGPEVRQAFSWASDQCFRAGKGDRLMANIYQLAREQLRTLGVADITGGEFCTVMDSDLFYSYRRQPVTGRMASLIWIEK